MNYALEILKRELSDEYFCLKMHTAFINSKQVRSNIDYYKKSVADAKERIPQLKQAIEVITKTGKL